ncbi:uncharacterized protein TNCV_4248711 [Trichonephila clavipes]|nr:uncharacterized protein TNCV_4248711 [Trichonephila clavipes]
MKTYRFMRFIKITILNIVGYLKPVVAPSPPVVDLEHMPEDADSDQPVGMRPSLSPPPLNAPIPSKGPLLPSEEGSLANGSSSPRDRPARINGAKAKKSHEEEKIQEYLQRSDTAVIFAEPVEGTSPKQQDEKPSLTPEPKSNKTKPYNPKPNILMTFFPPPKLLRYAFIADRNPSQS